MKILTDFVMNLRNLAVKATTVDYDGPVVYAFGGGDVTNETVPTGPFGPQIPFILDLFNQAAQLYNQGPPQAFPGVDAEGNVVEGGQLTPDINPNIQNTQDAIGGLAGGNIDQNNAIQQFLQQLAGGQNPGAQFGSTLTPGITGGINEQLAAGGNPLTGAASGQLPNQADAFGNIFGQDPNAQNLIAGQTPGGTQGGGTDTTAALQTLLGGPGGQNPYLDQLVQGAIQSQTNAFNQNVLPGISNEAQQAGQIGGSRQGIAEGIAGQEFQSGIGNTISSIYGNAFGQQIAAQGQAVGNVLGAQQGDQSAGLQAGGINNQNFQQYIQSLLQGTGQVGDQLGAGLGLGYGAIGSGTAQAGNLFSGGNALDLQQLLGSLGLIPGYQSSSLGQFGAVNQLGLQQYGLDQAGIDAQSQQYYFNQNSPFNLLSQYQQYITGPYGSTVGNYTGPQSGGVLNPPPPGFNPFGGGSFGDFQPIVPPPPSIGAPQPPQPFEAPPIQPPPQTTQPINPGGI